MESEEKVFITEFEKNGEKYEGPQINAASWEEAQGKAKEAIIVVGELD